MTLVKVLKMTIGLTRWLDGVILDDVVENIRRVVLFGRKGNVLREIPSELEVFRCNLLWFAPASIV